MKILILALILFSLFPEACITAFEARREMVETLADSIANEKAILLAGMALNDEVEIDAFNGDARKMQLDENIEELESLLDEAGNRNTSNALPLSYTLNSIYPNPFNSQTFISFSLPEAGLVDLSVFDIAGRKVATLISGNTSAGQQTLGWDAVGVPTGLYFVRINTPNGMISSKMTLIK